MQYTSGTTGHPKGCVLTHRYWTTLGHLMLDEFPYVVADDVMLTAQPFFYLDPQWNVVTALMAGRAPGRARRLPPLDVLGARCASTR